MRGWIAATALVGLAACAAARGDAAPLPEGLPEGLDGTSWRAETIAGRPVAGDVASTLTFQADGRVAGHGGCNRFGGTIGVADGRVRIGPLAATRMACAPAVMEQEQGFLAALEGAARLRRDGPFLLLEPDGAGAPSRLAPLVGPEDPPR